MGIFLSYAERGGMQLKGYGRLLTTLSLAAVLMAFAVSASAGAATQIGQLPTGDPDGTCAPGENAVQALSPSGNPYVVPPGGGVITAWQHRGHSVSPGSGRLQLWTPAGGTNFTLVDRSEEETFAAGAVNHLESRIPVGGGELLGLRSTGEDGTGCIFFAFGSDLIRYELVASDPAPGETRNLFSSRPTARLDVAATLEADADGDGFGDETQDCDPTDPARAEDCAPPETQITKGPKNKTKKKTATFEFTGTDTRAIAGFQCKLDAGPFALCASPHTVKVKKGKHTFQVQAIDEAGNIGPPATDTWKRKKKRKK